MPNDSETYRCPYCSFKALTSARLNSHISQSPACLENFVAANRPSMNPPKRRHSESPTPGLSSIIHEAEVPNNEPTNNNLSYSSFSKAQPSTKRARVDDEEETPVRMANIFEEFEPPAGDPLPKPPNSLSNFEQLLDSQRASGSEPWAPFSSLKEWDFARWIMNSGLSKREMDDLLSLDYVRKI